MTWNYLEGTEQRGPVTEADFEALVRAGKITYDTYVWREGMADWQPYGQVRAAATGGTAQSAGVAGVICAECGRTFPPDQVIKHGDVFICSTCKPIFLQKLKEGVAVTTTMNYAGFWIRFGAKFLDGIILAIPFYSYFFGSMAVHGFRQPQEMTPMRIVFMLISYVLPCCYYTFFVGKFGATPGKMVAKLRVVNADGSEVGYGKALGRYFAAEFISGCCTLTIGYMMAGWDDQKRALHDRICNTRVIRK